MSLEIIKVHVTDGEERKDLRYFFYLFTVRFYLTSCAKLDYNKDILVLKIANELINFKLI